MENYIHGYSVKECKRLVAQAEILAPAVFANIDLSAVGKLIEIGCGVGAQTKQMLTRWPHLKITAVDKSESHLNFAKKYLSTQVDARRVQHFLKDIAELPFDENTFDAAISIWVLEHTACPLAILSELSRVLKCGGEIFLTEVDNSTFEFFPANKIINSWWDKLNSIQKKTGQPYIGKDLINLATDAGFVNIQTHAFAAISSYKTPARRLELLRYLRDLLLSAQTTLLDAGLVEKSDIDEIKNEFSHLETTDVNFQYCAMQLRATKP